MSPMSTDFLNVKAMNLATFQENDAVRIEGFCPWQDHSSNRVDISIEDFNLIIEENANAFPEVESICLINAVTPDLLYLMLNHCPKLCCLHCNLAQFRRHSLVPLLNAIAPKLLHLSTNGSITTIGTQFTSKCVNLLSDLIEKCRNLEDWELTIKANDDFDAKCLERLSETLTYLCVKNEKCFEWDEQISESPAYRQHSLENYMRHLSLGSGRGLEFLRLEYDREEYRAQQAFQYIAGLSQLRGLNISVRNEIATDGEYYKKIANMEKLETFTMQIQPADSDSQDNTNEILRIISRAKFRNTLKRFKLIDAELEGQAFELVMNAFENLESLQFINCVLLKEDVQRIVQRITQMKDLNEMIVDITETDEPNSEFRHFNMEDLTTIEIHCKPKLKTFYTLDLKECEIDTLIRSQNKEN